MTVTVAVGVTVPSSFRITGMSPSVAWVTRTICAAAALGCGFCANFCQRTTATRISTTDATIQPTRWTRRGLAFFLVTTSFMPLECRQAWERRWAPRETYQVQQFRVRTENARGRCVQYEAPLQDVPRLRICSDKSKLAPHGL